MAGEHFTGDLSKFVELGIKIDYSGNVKFTQVPIVGTEEFMMAWTKDKMGVIRGILGGIRGLSRRQVALYLLRKAGHGCRVVCYLRTWPRDLIKDFVTQFDDELRITLESVVGLVIDDNKWEQAGLRVKQSGLGLSKAADIADVAYLSSRDATYEDCQALDSRYVWDDGTERGNGSVEVIGEWLCGCVSRVNAHLEEPVRFRLGARPGTAKQGLLMELVHKRRMQEMLDRAGLWDKARLQAMGAPRSGSWLDAPPNRALTTQLSNAEVQYGVGRRLGCELCEEGPCPFCVGVMDKWGAHCESCMAGGDKTVNHNVVRDVLYAHARRAHTAPRLEACGVTRLLGLEGGGGGQSSAARRCSFV